jgi:uncharacterized protein (TIGR03083 family)
MRLTAALGESWEGVLALLDGLSDDEAGLPTPCEGWSVRDIAAHLGHVEGMGHGFPQPPPPPGFDASRFEGFHALTEEGVAARRSLPAAEVVDEVHRAARLSLARYDGFGEADWDEPAPSPIGMVPARQGAEIRMADVQVHLFDLRHALGRPLDPGTEPTAIGLLVDRALRLAGWGAVKGAGLPDGSHIRISIEGHDPHDLVVEDGRGGLAPSSGPEPADRITGGGVAFVLAVSGRGTMLDAAGGLAVDGDAARRFLEGYRLFL